MSTNFEWRTDEDDSHWEDQLPSSQVRSGDDLPGSRLRRSRPILIVILLLAAVTATILYVLANRQVEKATTAAETEVLQSFLLLQQAAAGDDLDLFMTLVDDESRKWYDLQYKLFRYHLYLDRPSLGLTARPILSATAILSNAQVSLSPDFISATLTIHQPYVVRDMDGLTETVILERTEIYHRQDGDWHLAELPDSAAFWGNWVTNRGQNFALIYPKRDEEIGQRLAVELDELVGRICAEIDQSRCPGRDAQVRLARNADSLMRLNHNFESIYFSNNYVSLPAPSLVGRPQDEAGYQALYRAYAAWVVGMLFDELGDAPIFLSRYGLRPPPAPYVPLPATTTFIDSPPVAWPDEDLVLICTGSATSQVLSYNPRANRWQRLPFGETVSSLYEQASFRPTMVQGAPDNDGVLITVGGDFPDESRVSWQTYLWRDGREQLLLNLDHPYYLLPDSIQRIFDPGGRRLVVIPDGLESDEFRVGYVEYDACLAGDCELRQTSGFPVPSSDGRHTLVFSFAGEGLQAILTDEAGQTLGAIDGIIFWPLWLDNESFVLVRVEWTDETAEPAERVTAVVRGRLAPDTTAGYVLETVLTEEDLRQAMPEDQRPAELDINLVLAQPALPDRWLISTSGSAGTNEPGEQYGFLYDAGRDELFPVPEMTGLLSISEPFISPDGRFLAVYDYNIAQLWLLDLAGDPAEPLVRAYDGQYNAVDWSADGYWMVLNGQQQMVLANPLYDFQRPVPFELTGCQGAFWVKTNSLEPSVEGP